MSRSKLNERAFSKSNSKSLIDRILIILILVCVIILLINKFIQDDTPIGFGCYYENAILLNQYIDDTDWTGGGDCTGGCLFMDVYSEDITFMPCGHIDNIKWVNKTYYFAKEGINKNLEIGDKIRVKWCYINKNIGRRIREVIKK